MIRHEQLILVLDAPVFELDGAGRIVYASPALQRWTGAETGDSFSSRLNAGEQGRFEQSLGRVLGGMTRTATLELMLTPAGGEVVAVEIKLAALALEQGKVSGAAGWLRDLSLEKASEMAANVQGTHLLDLVENVSDACVVESAEGLVEMVNGAFCDLFGIKSAAQSLVGMTCAQLFEEASKATEKRVGPIYFPLDSDEADLLEFALEAGQGIEQQTLPVASDSGIAGRLHLFRPTAKVDARDVKTLSAISATAAAQIELIERIARELAATVEGAGSALRRTEQLELPTAALEHFRQVENSAKAAFAAIAGLIDFSRLEASEVTLDNIDFHLRELIASRLERMVLQAESLGLQLKLRIEQDVPETLHGDGVRLMLALRNLLECGLAGDDAGAELSVYIEPEYVADGTSHLSFTVEHTQARGMARRKSYSPAGLMKYSLARQIVRALGGRIEVRERKESIAYTFTAAFPIRGEKPPRTRPTFVTLTGLPVLIVSSDAAERQQLATLARSWRMHPREADNAAMALQLLARAQNESQPIPLVITANHMRVQDGFMLAFRIKNQSALRNTALIMLARDGRPGDAIQCRENGISAYLRHPIGADQLNEAISAVVGAEADVEATQTLITRHSLRESKAGSVLLIDAHREQAGLAAKALRKRDYRVVVVDNAADAMAALLQDIFDLVLVDPATPGFLPDIEITAQIRALFTDDRDIPVLLADGRSGSEAINADNSEYNGVISKPYERESIATKIGRFIDRQVAK
jgi:CheY-like chemotaxis protein/PAS domain-containing protein